MRAIDARESERVVLSLPGTAVEPHGRANMIKAAFAALIYDKSEGELRRGFDRLSGSLTDVTVLAS
jgi:hypothetical protein